MKLKKNDNVIVVSGKDKGKTGKISKAFPAENKVIIEGVNVKKRHLKGRGQSQKGQIIDKTMPIDVSNVMLVDPKTKKPTRVGKRMDGKKLVRYAKKSDTNL
jgi:large subunit ribosomal protein L24